jgi:transposase
MVQVAQEQSISESARVFDTTRPTVRKWLNRYKKYGLKGLEDRPRIPKKIPHKLKKKKELEIVQLRKKYKMFGPQRLKEYFNIHHSTSTIYRVLKSYGLIKKKKKKYQKKRELYEKKKKMKPFEKIQFDVKYLNDIVNYFPNMIRNHLPKFQLTIRDVKTGGTFYGYAYENNSTNTAIFACYVIEHLKRCGIKLREKITFQNDNGSEFIGNVKKKEKSLYEEILAREKDMIINERIPPARPTYNSDVETFHKLIEDELYDVEKIESNTDLLKKAYCYILFFNYLRKNRGKENQSPIDILKHDYKSKLENTKNKKILKVFSLPPIITDYYTNYFIRSGYHVPEPPTPKI